MVEVSYYAYHYLIKSQENNSALLVSNLSAFDESGATIYGASAEIRRKLAITPTGHFETRDFHRWIFNTTSFLDFPTDAVDEKLSTSIDALRSSLVVAEWKDSLWAIIFALSDPETFRETISSRSLTVDSFLNSKAVYLTS